jgi:glucose-1-phosphate cytidylyltransferase
MKVIILAGGMGTRLAEETHLIPKPMVTIGEKPIIWHLMSTYANYGFKEFVIALGYKGEVIKDFFLNYYNLNGDVTVNLVNGSTEVHKTKHPDWIIHLVDTGLKTMTGGRIKRLKEVIGNETFMVTYADGLSNIDIKALLKFHHGHGKLATVTAVPPPSRFGNLQIENSNVISFNEKPRENEKLINGGFFVFEPGIFDFIENDEISLEREPLENITLAGQLMAYEHTGFWQMMDTIHEKELLNKLYYSGETPWLKK